MKRRALAAPLAFLSPPVGWLLLLFLLPMVVRCRRARARPISGA